MKCLFINARWWYPADTKLMQFAFIIILSGWIVME